MKNLDAISFRNIEINSCGPFVHSHYEVDGFTVSQEGPLAGRAEFLVNYALSTLSNLQIEHDVQILDIGSYDGWILNQLYSRGGFVNLTGVEPRGANIDRGYYLRNLLNIEDPARHLCGTLEDVETLELTNRFDFVICFGVVHHLNDILDFLSRISLTLSTNGYLLLECLTLSDDLVTPEIQSAIEPKDIIYEDKQLETSIIGVKLESNYYPGSTRQTGTVQIPTRKSLTWLVAQAGFEIIEINSGWNKNNSSDSLIHSHRKEADSTVILARWEGGGQKFFNENRISEIERIFTCGVLDERTISQIEELVHQNSKPYNQLLRTSLEQLGTHLNTQESRVIRAIIHEPVAKLMFEMAKSRLHSGSLDEALEMLIEGVTKLDSDWRTVYRSFFLLAKLDLENSATWLKRLARCNPEFPISGIKNDTFLLSQLGIE